MIPPIAIDPSMIELALSLVSEKRSSAVDEVRGRPCFRETLA
jgi:hypothetical protein